MPVQHVVLFRFSPELQPDQVAQMRDLVAAFPERIPGFRLLRLGTDELNGGERAQGWQFLLLSEHDDEPALRAYQAHPVHQEFVVWTREHHAAVLAFDYPITAATALLPGPDRN